MLFLSELCLGIKLAVKLLQSNPKHLYLESFLTPIFSTSLRFHYHWIFILIQNIAVHRFLGHCSWTAQDSYKFNSFYKPSSISQLLPISIKTTKLIIPKDNTNAAKIIWCWRVVDVDPAAALSSLNENAYPCSLLQIIRSLFHFHWCGYFSFGDRIKCDK